MDRLTFEQRKKNMCAVKSRDTDIELLLRKSLWKNGIRYRKNLKSIPGCPDIAITKYKIAIFCDGEFWHGKDFEKIKIDTNMDFWKNKIKSNIEHDTEITIQLRDQGWLVIRFWSNQIKNELSDCIDAVKDAIKLRQK